MTTLQGATLLLTGSGQAAESLARALAGLGAEVIWGRGDLEGEDTPVIRDSGDFRTLALDPRSRSSWQAALDRLREQGFPLDSWVHLPLGEEPATEGKRAVSNSTGSVAESEGFDRHLRERLGPLREGLASVGPVLQERGRGSVVWVSSLSAMVGLAGRSAEVAGEWALRGLLRVAALELAPRVRINSLHIDSPARPVGGSESIETRDVASLVAYLVGPESAYSTGSEFVLDHGALLRSQVMGAAQPHSPGSRRLG